MSILTDDEIVERVIRHLENLEFDLDMVRHHMRVMLERESWKRFRTPNGNQITHDKFVDFVTARRPAGIETNVEGLRSLAGNMTALVGMVEASARQAPAGSVWFSTEDIAIEVHRLHGLPVGVARRLVELEYRDLLDTGVAVIRSHVTEEDRKLFHDAIAETVAEP